MKLFLMVVGVIFFGFPLFSQTDGFLNQQKEGQYYFSQQNYNLAERKWLECYKMDSTNVELLGQLMDLSLVQNNWKRVAFVSRKLQVLKPELKCEFLLQESKSYFNLQDYKNCEKTLKRSFGCEKDSSFAKRLFQLKQNVQFAQQAIQNPVPFQPENLGKAINSAFADYLPGITQDGLYLIYTRYVSLATAFPSLQEDFYISKKESGHWVKSKPLSRTINTEKNEGAPSLSADGKILYFAACNRSDSQGNCDIYYTFNRRNFWTTPKNLEEVNSEYWDSQPNISADGSTLYFVSDRPGGFGGKDIWAVPIFSDGSFGEIYNLGPHINTPYDEISPFLHFDNQTLYFASDGWPGMGEKDIFMSKKQNNGPWTLPKNLSYPINSSLSDNSFIVEADGKTAYFSSNRPGGFGLEDIYTFDLYQEVQAEKVGFFKAEVIDEMTRKAISVSYLVSNINDSSEFYLKEANDGQLSMGLKANQKYSISVFAEGYLYYSSQIKELQKDSLKVIYQNIELKRIKSEAEFELQNIVFDFDKATLKSESLKELKAFAEYLKRHPNMRILIEGHTDNIGTEAYNQNLSTQRSEAVKSFLVEHKIEASRLECKGFGSSRAISQKDNEQEQNRRVVVKILSH